MSDVTAHPIDTRTREHLLAENERLSKLEESLRAHLSRTINRAESAEHRATRAEAQSAIRGRAVVIYQQRAREAEERIQAVEDALDGYTKFIHVEHIRAALKTVP